MPHQTVKKQRLDHAASAGNDDFVATFDDLSVDVLANIFGFLSGAKEIMSKRCINKKTMEAVKKTVVPLTDFRVNSVKNYNTMVVMTEALPNMQQITIYPLGEGHKYSDGEDPDEEVATRYAHFTSHDIEIISNFSKLRDLDIRSSALLNGRYPFFFNSFPLLQKLSINTSNLLKWDLDMLAGFPLLKELICYRNPNLTGSMSSLRVLKDSLVKVKIYNCPNVEGNFMDLADFPRLKKLDLGGTAVTGDIPDIGESYFLSLEYLYLPKGVYGCSGYKFQRISEANDLVRTLYLLKKQRPALSMLEHWYAQLSEDSPEWYEAVEEHVYQPPLTIRFVQAGSRVGYRWKGKYAWDTPCEVNWLDPEPDTGSSDYEKYTEELQQIESEVNFYKGFHQPPTQAEYRERIFGRYRFR
jgi:hypothetical protein